MISLKKIFLIILFTFLIDFSLSNIFFKQTKFWNANLYKGKSWRIFSEHYHHGRHRPHQARDLRVVATGVCSAGLRIRIRVIGHHQ